MSGSGKAGGGSSHTPVEAPDSLHSIATVRVIDIIGEGVIGGFAGPTRGSLATNPLTAIYLNETPVANGDNSLNFKNVQIDTRLGTQNQDYVQGWSSVENEIAVGVELVYGTPYVRSETNLALSAIKLRLYVNGLTQVNTSNGDINGYQVAYAIDVQTDGGAYVQVYSGAFTGKTTSKYARTHRIDLPIATTGWNIRVRRLTTQATSSAITDKTFVEAFTEVIDGMFRYPNTAYAAIAVDAVQFQSIPTRAYDVLLLLVKVPTNYDPIARTYTGIWDGTFKTVWSDNPAWAFYDLATNPRYGLGKYISASQIDKWTLYTIAQYCDELVPDGLGGTEPRFACNVYFQVQADAHKVMQDLATVFRGISYYAASQIFAVCDKPDTPQFTVTNAHVVGGKFNYSGTSRKARHTVALVTWNDPADFYRQKVEYVPDPAGVARYGVNTTQVVSVGCTSQGQAQRTGRWILYTERLETDTVSFDMDTSGAFPLPGRVIRIADSKRAGRRIGGRVHTYDAGAYAGDRVAEDGVTTRVTEDGLIRETEGTGLDLSTIFVDAQPSVMPVAGNTLILRQKDGTEVTRTVVAAAANSIAFTPPLADYQARDAMWAIETGSLVTQQFKVLGVTENNGKDKLTYNVLAAQRDPSKFALIDSQTYINLPPVSVIPSPVQIAPTAVTLTQYQRAGTTASEVVITAQWDAPTGAVSYEVQVRKDSGDWSEPIPRRNMLLDYKAAAGVYTFRVLAINVANKKSAWTTSSPITVGQATLPPLSTQPKDITGTLSGSTVTVDCSLNDHFKVVLGGAWTLAIINAQPSTTFILDVFQDTTGGRTLALPANCQPLGSVPYVATATPGAPDKIGFDTSNAGGLWGYNYAKPPMTGGIGGGAFTVTVNTATPNGSNTSSGSPVTASASCTATPHNGTAPITGVWTYGGSSSLGTACTPSGTSTPTLTLSKTARYTNRVENWTYTATDAVGLIATYPVVFTITIADGNDHSGGGLGGGEIP